MAIPVWPITLPTKPLIDGYREAYPNNLLRSDVDAGFGKVRNKGATPPFKFDATFEIDGTQRSTLYSFVQNTLYNGALRFQLAHPVDNTVVEMRIVGSGEDLFSLVAYGLHWTVSMKFEVLP